MIEQPFKVSPLFEANYSSNRPMVINQGGTSSGKTYSIIQVLCAILASEPNKVATVVGRDLPNLKVGAIRDFKEIWNNTPYFDAVITRYNGTDNIAHFYNGSKLEFKSFQDPHDARGSRRHYLFINEANGIPYEVADQLMIRTKIRTWIDYNPTAPFWVHDEIMAKRDKADYTYIESTYVNNPFLEQKIIREIEAKKDTDPYWWQVYGMGQLGRLEGAVYTNWKECSSIPDGAKLLGYGLDFGFSTHPAAMVELWRYDSELYVNELIYDTGLTNQDISRKLKEIEPDRGALIYADSAEPKSIEELRRDGWRIEPCVKGADSVNFGIDLIKNHTVNVTRNSQNLIKEFQLYTWATDRMGKPTGKPIKQHDHGMDAMRYAASMTLTNKKGLRYFGTLN